MARYMSAAADPAFELLSEGAGGGGITGLEGPVDLLSGAMGGLSVVLALFSAMVKDDISDHCPLPFSPVAACVTLTCQ